MKIRFAPNLFLVVISYHRYSTPATAPMAYSKIQLTRPAPNDDKDNVETWLFFYKEAEEKRCGYMTVNFSDLLSGCKLSACGADGLPIEGFDIDESVVDVRVSDFETLELAEYIEMTTAMHKQALEEAINSQEEEAFCLPMPDFGKLAKGLFHIGN